jgi:hypothetical protein
MRYYSISKYPEGLFCTCETINFVKNALPNSSNLLTEFGGNFLNQSRALPKRVRENPDMPLHQVFHEGQGEFRNFLDAR